MGRRQSTAANSASSNKDASGRPATGVKYLGDIGRLRLGTAKAAERTHELRLDQTGPVGKSAR